MTNALALAPESTAHAIAAAAQEEGAAEIGKLLKFSKGHYIAGTEEITTGTRFIAHIEHWTRGWVKFRNGQLIERRVGRVADGFIVPRREELDDQDSSTWSVGPRGVNQRTHGANKATSRLRRKMAQFTPSSAAPLAAGKRSRGWRVGPPARWH
jgi:hypothetical protein